MSDEMLTTKCLNIQKNKGDQRATSQVITIILPACDAEESIGSLILLTRLYADNVIVVDDGSVDRTAEVAKKAGANVIVHGERKGKREALKTGFKAASNTGADIIVTMNSNWQHNPADILMLVEPIIEGKAEMVTSSRCLNGISKTASIYCHMDHTLQNTTAQINSDLTITDQYSGFRAFSASSKNIFRFDSQDMAIEREMLAEAGKAGISIKEVEIGVCHDFEGPLRNPIKRIVRFLKTVVEDIEANKLLYYNSVPGFALATCSFYMAFKFLEAYFFGIGSLRVGPMVLMSLLAISGIYMTLRGIIMHSLVGMRMQTESAQ
jgi:glycosyltransferase involved in cell wall biosynthesis